jgi:hypothetical protein
VYKKACFSDLSLQKLAELGEVPFKSFVKSNTPDIAEIDFMEEQLNELVARLTSSLQLTKSKKSTPTRIL